MKHLMMMDLNIKDELLCYAYDRFLAAKLLSDGAPKLTTTFSDISGEDAQSAFEVLIAESLIFQGKMTTQGDGEVCIYLPTSKGLDEVRAISCNADFDVDITGFSIVEQPTHLQWDSPEQVAQHSRWVITADVFTSKGSRAIQNVEIADVGFYHITKNVLDESGIELSEVFDSADMSLFDNPAFDDEGNAVGIDELPELLGLPKAAICSILVISEIKVASAFIGMGLGRKILKKLIQRETPCGGVGLLSPFPLQYMAGCSSAKDSDDQDVSTQALKSYYASLGFVVHPHFPSLMVCDLNMLR